RHTNPLCYGLPPHNLLPYGTTRPTTSANMVRKSSQQFNVKKEDTKFAPLSPKRNQSFPSRSQLIVFFFVPSIVVSVESNAFVPFPHSCPTFY
ncbi:hypothetical protein AVEN_231390-1, partial [Araneus ventricosus]